MVYYEPRYLFEGESPVYGSKMPDFEEEKAAEVVLSHKFTDVIVLLEEGWGEDFKAAYEAKGINVIHCPIEDFGVPSDEELQKWIPQIVKLVQSPNHKILIHCMGGAGRTGLISACVLARLNKQSGEEAIKAIRKRIPHALDTTQQETFVSNFVKKYFSDKK